MSPTLTEKASLVKQNSFMVSGHPPEMKSPSGQTCFLQGWTNHFHKAETLTSPDSGKISIQTHHSKSQWVRVPQRILLSFQS